VNPTRKSGKKGAIQTPSETDSQKPSDISIPMKILLIYPYALDDRIQNDDIHTLPMGLFYIGALLKFHDYDVDILDFSRMRDDPDQIREILRKMKPDIAGFSIVNANRWGGIDTARMLRELHPHVRIVFGGVGATFLCDHLMTHFPEIDVIVRGEGEYPFLNLIRAFEEDQVDALSRIRGIVFRENGQTLKTPPGTPIENPDDLPGPAAYFSFTHLSLSRGCPGKCTFCGSPEFWGPRVRFHSPDYFVDQIEMLYRRGIRFFYVSDDMFTLREKCVIEICRMIIERKLHIQWVAISHVNSISDPMLYWMRLAGCIQISFGVESGSERIRKVLNKKAKTEEIERVFALTRSYGILPRAYFIYGCPGETGETIGESIALMLRIKPLSAIFYILSIFPGTPLYGAYREKHAVSEDVWLNRIEDIMYHETDPELDGEMIRAFGKRLRNAFHKGLCGFAENIELVDRPELYPFHADFLSRLGMTFSHGDFSQIPEIDNPDRIAARLFERSLTYGPMPRAYLGLGVIRQKNRDHARSIRILSEGIKRFPEDISLNMCLGISYMNTADWHRALPCFEVAKETPDGRRYLSECKKMMGT